jgi:hypothetical protein
MLPKNYIPFVTRHIAQTILGRKFQRGVKRGKETLLHKLLVGLETS